MVDELLDGEYWHTIDGKIGCKGVSKRMDDNSMLSVAFIKPLIKEVIEYLREVTLNVFVADSLAIKAYDIVIWGQCFQKR